MVALTLDGKGKVQYDQLLKQGTKADKIIHSTYDALVPVQITKNDPKRELYVGQMLIPPPIPAACDRPAPPAAPCRISQTLRNAGNYTACGESEAQKRGRGWGGAAPFFDPAAPCHVSMYAGFC